jgi:hypothetical protein
MVTKEGTGNGLCMSRGTGRSVFSLCWDFSNGAITARGPRSKGPLHTHPWREGAEEKAYPFLPNWKLPRNARDNAACKTACAPVGGKAQAVSGSRYPDQETAAHDRRIH